MRKMIKVLGLVAASLVLTLGFADKAAAADHTMHTGDVWGDVTGWSGTGWFNEYGDVVTICDKDADGYAVAMYVYYEEPTGNPMYQFRAGGEGTCDTKRARMGGKYNLPENTKIGFKFCRYSNGQGSECKDYTFYNDN